MYIHRGTPGAPPPTPSIPDVPTVYNDTGLPPGTPGPSQVNGGAWENLEVVTLSQVQLM